MKQKKEASKEYQEQDRISLEELSRKVKEIDDNTFHMIMSSDPSKVLLKRDSFYWSSENCFDDKDYYLRSVTMLDNVLREQWSSTIINPSKEISGLSIDVDWWIPEVGCGVIYQSGIHHGHQPYMSSKTECKEKLAEFEESVCRQETEEQAELVEWCINNWTKTDVEVRNEIVSKDLMVIEMFDMIDGASPAYVIKSVIDRVSDLYFYVDDKSLKQEFVSLKNDKIGACRNTSARNKNVKFFLQDQFYKVEKKMYHDPSIKFYLDRNRQRYQFTPMEDLSVQQLLGGFKITGTHFGYSFFNPRLFTWFIVNEHMQGKTCYDPTGGWGHRMLGSQLLKKYIYNDLSHNTVEGVKKIAEYHNITNTTFYENDARTFDPQEDYDCMFTCVPYYADERNTEEYECDGFVSQEDYNDFINKIFEKYEKKESCKSFGLVIREDMLSDELKSKAVETHILKLTRSHFQYYAPKQNNEYMYIFRKND